MNYLNSEMHTFNIFKSSERPEKDSSVYIKDSLFCIFFGGRGGSRDPPASSVIKGIHQHHPAYFVFLGGCLFVCLRRGFLVTLAPVLELAENCFED